MNEQRTHFELISVCSKNLDLINTYEYCFRFDISLSNCLVIILGDRISTSFLSNRLEDDNVQFLYVPENDLFAKLSVKFFNLNSPGTTKKILVVLFSYLFQSTYRSFKLTSWKRTLSPYSCQTLILDLWRTKVPILNYINFKKLVIMDGGTSTKNLKLLKNWELTRNKTAVLTNYLSNQKYHQRDRKSFRNSFQRFIYTIHCEILYGLPEHILSKIKGNWPVDTHLFSAYVNADDKKKHVTLNSYQHHKSIFQNFRIGDYAIVLGHPGFRTLDNSRKCLIDESYSKILYLFHPRDRRNFLLDMSERNSSYNRVERLNWEVLDIQVSIEIYLYQRKTLPAKIVTYQSSSSAFLEAVLDERVTVQNVEITSTEVK